MTSPIPKTFRVQFCMTDWYSIDVEADSRLSAIAQAQELHTEQDPASGFVFDIYRGGDDSWEAREVHS